MRADLMSRHSRLNACASGMAIVLACLASGTAAAQTSTTPSQAESETSPVDGGTGASAQEEIVVTGTGTIAGGLMKRQTAATAMSSITPAAIEEKLSVASPLQIANTLPGANFGSSDAYGLSIRNFLSIRGLDQTEIGFLVDNMPPIVLTNYFPYTETWADNENVSDITVMAGNSRLQDPIINASGGEFIMSIREPKDEFGGKLSGSVGSFDGWRGFGGIDTGYLGNSGLKAFASYSHSSARNYVGPGRNKKDHIDFRTQMDWSDRSRSTLYVAYDNLENARIPILTRAQAIDGVENDRLDQYAFSATYVPGVTAQYFKINKAYLESLIVSNNNDIEISDKVKIHIVPYYRYYDSLGASQSRLSPNSIFNGNVQVTPAFDPAQLQGGALVAAGAGHFRTHVFGANSYVEADLSPTNKLSFGYWYQHSRLTFNQNVQVVDQQGNFPGFSDATALKTTSGDVIKALDYTAKTETHQFFVGDTQSFLDDRLNVTLGFKQLFWKATLDNDVPGTPPRVTASWNRFMPRILASFNVDDRSQLYANVTTNARMPLPSGTYLTSYNLSTGATTAVGNTATKPEYTISAQIGYRYSGPINIDATAFYMKLKNHQVTGVNFINGFLQTTALNAGNLTIKGLSLESSTRPYGGFSFYGNAQYLDARFDDNLPIRGDFLPTKGKKKVLSPEWIVNVGGRFESGGFYATVAYKYVSEQFSTFMNDQTIPNIQTVDAAIGYKFGDIGGLKSPAIRFTVTNIGNKSYISTLTSAAPNSVATTGINGTVIPAGTPTYYVGAPRAALVTVSTEF